MHASFAPFAVALAQALTVIVSGLRDKVAAHGGRQPAVSPTTNLIWSYLGRLIRRFEALAARVDAGQPARPPRPRPERPASSDSPQDPPPDPPSGPAPLRLPRGHAWLIRIVPQTAPLGGQLQHLLRDPAVAALLAASPQAGRILRPLCRMFGIVPGPDVPPDLFPSAKPASPATAPASARTRKSPTAPPPFAERPPASHWPPPLRFLRPA